MEDKDLDRHVVLSPAAVASIRDHFKTINQIKAFAAAGEISSGAVDEVTAAFHREIVYRVAKAMGASFTPAELAE